MFGFRTSIHQAHWEYKIYPYISSADTKEPCTDLQSQLLIIDRFQDMNLSKCWYHMIPLPWNSIFLVEYESARIMLRCNEKFWMRKWHHFETVHFWSSTDQVQSECKTYPDIDFSQTIQSRTYLWLQPMKFHHCLDTNLVNYQYHMILVLWNSIFQVYDHAGIMWLYNRGQKPWKKQVITAIKTCS